MHTKYYYLFFLFPLFTKCFSYVHIIERAIASFDDGPYYSNKIKSCLNCKHYIENEKNEFSRCSKFPKYNPKKCQFIKNTNTTNGNTTHISNTTYIDKDKKNEEVALINFYLATVCRNNENMCGTYAKHYERKYNDFY
jgi:hypothetical protein